jgi:hypothetical protein
MVARSLNGRPTALVSVESKLRKRTRIGFSNLWFRNSCYMADLDRSTFFPDCSIEFT